MRSSFFVSAFFWRKNPVISRIFYIEFMATFVTPLTIFAVYIYTPLLLHNLLLPVTYLASQLAVGLAAGLDYRLARANH